MRNFTTQLKFCAAIICALLFNIESHAQSQTFTSSITSERFTDNSGNAIDGNLNTKANVRASSGLIVGLGSYSGRIELKFPQTVPANTTSYIKIDTDENLLPTLLGGSLGSLLSDVLGTVLIGNQEFTVQALNGGTSIITGRSEVENSMATDRLRIVVDGNGKYFIAITPNQAYDRVRLTNRLGSLVGLGNTKRLGVYDAYYATNPLECGNPSFTSFDGSGISLDLLKIGGAGVRNPQYAIDGNPANHSELNLGILSVLASIQQSIYFEGSSNTTDSFNIRLKLSPALISVGALNSINIIASNDGEVVQNIPFSSLLDVDLLSLIQIQANKNLPTSIPFSPGVPVDKITVRYSSLLNVEIAQSLDLYGITRTPALPIISESSKNVSVCIGTSADLTASTNPTDLQIRWYDAATGGNLIASTNSGDVFTTPTINEDTTFYVASVKSGCDTESARVAVHVRAIDRPTAADITITGAENDICESSNAILTPSSSINGTFNWFFDPDKVTPITNGLTQGSITYTIDENGKLTVSGLTPTDTPISYYVSITNDETGCNNANGDLAQATINVITNTLNPTITLDTNITADDVININESTTSIIISGDTGGDSQPGDSVTLTINKVKYSGTVAPDGSFQIPVNGSDLLADSDLTIQATVESNNTICTSSGTDTETYTIDVTPPTAPTVNEQQTNDTTPAITGTANSTDQLSIDLNGITYTEGDGNLTDNGDNTWMLQIPTGNELPEGVYDIIATVNDAAGNSATDNTINELTIDLTDPQIPTVTPLSTNDNTPKISGTALSEDIIEITVNGITYSEGDGNLTDNSNDTWTLQIPDGNAIPDGTYDVLATATDIAGNTANDNTTDELTINTLAPNAPTVDLLATNDNTPNITGTADSVDDLTVLVNGITYTEGDGNLTDNGDDTWTLQIPDANTLPDGIYDVKATASDGMLSANDSTINELTIDTTPPSTPTVNQQDTNDATPIITGTAISEDNLKIIVNGITYLEGNGDLTDNGDDTWTLQIPDANELPDGIYDVQATLTDEVGNIANDSTTDELNINTSIPDEPTVDFLATSDNTPTITGTANSIDELEVTVNGITYTESDGNLIDNSDNTWALQIPDGNALPDGFYDVKALVTDTFGNTNSDTTLNELTIDTADPTIPTVNSLITNDTTPTITGTLDSQDQLSVTVNGITYVEKVGNLIDNENNTWTLNIPATNELPEGVYDVVASVMDPIGNTSVDTTTDELTIDATLPNTPTVNSLATEDTTPMINGTATSTTDLTVEVNGILYTEGDGNLTDNNDNTWTLQIPDENTLTEGVYDVIATATDMAGNSASDNTTNELTINSAIITPTTPTVDQLTTEDTTPTITGTADSNDNLIVTVDGKTYTKGDGSLFDNGDNTWALTIPTNNTLSLKTYDVVVTVMNASGGTATDTTTDELKIVSPDEDTFPITPTVNQITTGDTTPIITGTADSDDNINVSLDGNNYTEGDGDLTDNGDDTWTLQIPDDNMLSEGVYDIVATATNNNGNSSTDNTTNELTITSPANTPTIPTVNQLITEDTTPIITGTADSNDTLNIGLDGNIYTEEDGNLTDNGDDTWTLQIPDENTLSGGVYDIIAVATNDSGNSSTDNTTNELTVITADDNTPPTTPTVDQIVTDDTTPIVTGTADSNDDLSIGLNGNTYNEGDGDLIDNGDNTWTLQVPDDNILPDGVYDVVVTATNADGNTANDGTINELTIISADDNTPPTTPTVDLIVTDDTTPIVTGTANSNDDLSIGLNGNTYNEGDGDLTDNGDNTWTLQVPDDNILPDGVYDVVVTATDTDGNIANDDTTDEITIISADDNTPPTTPTVDQITTDDPTPIVTGTADSNDDLSIGLNGNTYNEGDGDLTDNGDNTWVLQVPDDNILPEGVYDVVVTATDTDGNTANDNTTNELSIESIPVSDITISKTVDNINPLVGDYIEFTIRVINSGETEFKDVVIDEVIATGFTYQQHSASEGNYIPSNGVWNIPSLMPNQTVNLSIKVQVNPTGNHSNVATIISTNPTDDNISNNTSEVIIELSCLTVFNEFTPNNDGYNDFFRIECIEQYPNNVLKIFNRYGNKVFETTGYLNNWSGIANVNGTVDRGKQLPAGVYFYSLQIDELGEDISGWLYIAK